MRATFNINFFCRQSKVGKLGKAPVEMSIIINGRRTYISLPRKENPKDFHKLITAKKANNLKDYLEQTYQKVLQTITEMSRRGIPLKASTLKEYIQRGFSESYTIEDLFVDYLQILQNRVGIDLSKVVFRRYELVRDLFYSHIDKNKQITEVTNSIVTDFYAKLNKQYESTTAAGMIAKLKTVIVFGIENGKLTTNPFNGIKIRKKTKDVMFLTESEIHRIMSKKMVGRLEKVRDLFLFQCFTGLSYSDMANLTKDDFNVNNKGQVYVKKTRQKTGVIYLVVLLDDAKRIAEKYGYSLPVLSNQRYNSYLKEIKDLCHISKPLHTHIGRHTAATYLLNKGIPIETVAKILGHSDIKQTQHYAKLLDDSVFKEFKKLEETLK
jgi:site-specific recombinase XerD